MQLIPSSTDCVSYTPACTNDSACRRIPDPTFSVSKFITTWHLLTGHIKRALTLLPHARSGGELIPSGGIPFFRRNRSWGDHLLRGTSYFVTGQFWLVVYFYRVLLNQTSITSAERIPCVASVLNAGDQEVLDTMVQHGFNWHHYLKTSYKFSQCLHWT